MVAVVFVVTGMSSIDRLDDLGVCSSVCSSMEGLIFCGGVRKR